MADTQLAQIIVDNATLQLGAIDRVGRVDPTVPIPGAAWNRPLVNPVSANPWVAARPTRAYYVTGFRDGGYSFDPNDYITANSARRMTSVPVVSQVGDIYDALVLNCRGVKYRDSDDTADQTSYIDGTHYAGLVTYLLRDGNALVYVVYDAEGSAAQTAFRDAIEHASRSDLTLLRLGDDAFNVSQAATEVFNAPSRFNVYFPFAAYAYRWPYFTADTFSPDRHRFFHANIAADELSDYQTAWDSIKDQLATGVGPALTLAFGETAVRADVPVVEPDPLPPPTLPMVPVPIPAPVIPPAPAAPVLNIDTSPSYHARMGGAWKDITPYVVAAQWKHGQRLPNQAGSLMRGAAGTLTLDNRDGEWSPYNPAAGFEPYPGVPVEIWSGNSRNSGNILFRGWSKGVSVSTPSTQRDIAQMTMISTLERLGQLRPDAFQRFTGLTSTSGAFSDLLLGAGLVTTDLVIHTGAVQLYGTRLSSSGQFGTGRTFGNLQDGLKLLALLEGGRIYDQRDGKLVFESLNSPRRQQSVAAVRIAGDDVWHAEARDTDEGIINHVRGRRTQIRAQGVIDLPMVAPDGSSGADAFPVTIAVGPRQRERLDFRLDPAGGTLFIQSLEQPVKGTHWTVSPDVTGATVTPSTATNRVVLTCFNPDRARTVIFSILSIRGQGAGATSVTDFDPVEHAKSVARYGRRAMVYPGDIVSPPGRPRARAQDIVDRHNGMMGDTDNPNPPKMMTVTLRNPNRITWDISTLVILEWKTADKTYLTSYPFWVDGVSHSVDLDGNHDIRLELYDAVPDRG